VLFSRNKREARFVFSMYVEALAEERAAGEAVTTKIGAGS
jgi:hypothetical protein